MCMENMKPLQSSLTTLRTCARRRLRCERQTNFRPIEQRKLMRIQKFSLFPSFRIPFFSPSLSPSSHLRLIRKKNFSFSLLLLVTPFFHSSFPCHCCGPWCCDSVLGEQKMLIDECIYLDSIFIDRAKRKG